MKQLIQFLLIVCTLSTVVAEPAFLTMDRDPTTVAEFSRIVQDAARKGAVRVRFPSGEWNWYNVPPLVNAQKEDPIEWSANAAILPENDLAKWLTDHKIAAVEVSMAKDCDPRIFFTIETFLRKRGIVYAVRSASASFDQKTKIQLGKCERIAK